MTDSFSCIIVDDEALAIEMLREQLTHLYKNINICAACTDWADALHEIRTVSFDLIFMDISMPGKNGIDLLKLLPGLESEIIFITAHDQYALDAFGFSTSGYLLKPVSDKDLSLAINRALTRIQGKRATRQSNNVSNTTEKIGIPGKYGIDYININDIIYLESINKCTRIVTATKEYNSFSPLIKFRTVTDNHLFLQVHRSFIVNLNYILRYETSGLIIMSNKQEIPLARTFKNDFLDRFSNNF
jgi:two-component system LytT family response regulator